MPQIYLYYKSIIKYLNNNWMIITINAFVNLCNFASILFKCEPWQTYKTILVLFALPLRDRFQRSKTTRMFRYRSMNKSKAHMRPLKQVQASLIVMSEISMDNPHPILTCLHAWKMVWKSIESLQFHRRPFASFHATISNTSRCA